MKQPEPRSPGWPQLSITLRFSLRCWDSRSTPLCRALLSPAVPDGTSSLMFAHLPVFSNGTGSNTMFTTVSEPEERSTSVAASARFQLQKQ